MKKIEAIFERSSDGGYCVFCVNEMFSGIGDTLEAAKQNMLESMDFFIEGSKEAGNQYPEWLDGKYEISYKFDIHSLLAHYSGIFTPASLVHLTGITSKQIWSYTRGTTKPSPAQLKKIQASLQRLSVELSTISLL